MMIVCSELQLIYCFVYVQVLSQRTASSFRSMNSVSLLYLRGSSSVHVPSLLKTATYSSYSSDNSSSKRRSRGPVMAAKKASEGIYCAILYNYKIVIIPFKHIYLWHYLVIQT